MLEHFSEILSSLIKKLDYNYGSKLEQYILERNPQSSADVERLTFEYNQKQSRSYIWETFSKVY